MPPAPVRAAPPPAPGGGRKIMGMSTTQLIIVLAVALVGGGYLLYRRSKANAANAAASTATNPSGCPQGTAPDAQGNCVQISQDYSGQLGTLQTEIADLQSAPEPADKDTAPPPDKDTAPPPDKEPPPANTVKVPNVVGRHAGQAHNFIQAAGLVPVKGEKNQQPTDITTGTSPAVGTSVKRGSRVTIHARKPPKRK